MKLEELLATGMTLAKIANDAVEAYNRIRETAAQNGATATQLAEMDARLSSAIARREAEDARLKLGQSS